jgi:hypothetical protein
MNVSRHERRIRFEPTLRRVPVLRKTQVRDNSAVREPRRPASEVDTRFPNRMFPQRGPALISGSESLRFIP